MARQTLRQRLRIWIRRRSKNRSKGQSLVELTFTLPILLIMLSGLIEFGFMLNHYLDLIDAAREAARFASNDDPLHDDATGVWTDFNANFYNRVDNNTSQALNWGGQIQLDPATDDIVVSVFSVNAGSVVRFPSASPNGYGIFGNHSSEFTNAEVAALVDPTAPNSGYVLLEIFYDYHMLLGLPWIKAFVPDPLTLHAYTIMPNASAEPTPTP